MPKSGHFSCTFTLPDHPPAGARVLPLKGFALVKESLGRTRVSDDWRLAFLRLLRTCFYFSMRQALQVGWV